MLLGQGSCIYINVVGETAFALSLLLRCDEELYLDTQKRALALPAVRQLTALHLLKLLKRQERDFIWSTCLMLPETDCLEYIMAGRRR
jgi:hypothetical protein